MVVPTCARSSGKDKSLHPFQQGDAVWQWIEPLTDPGDLVVDPFSGSGEWGWIAGQMGRRYIGCDVAKGGSTRIVV
jgi:DNA modification methylase